MGILNPRIKRRRPKSLEDLKSIIIEEWNSIPENLLKKLFENYINRKKKVIEFDRASLEPKHLNELKEKKKNNIYGKKKRTP